MRDVNEAIAESIERGGGGLGVSDLLAKVRAAGAGPEPAPVPAPDLDGLTATVAAAAGRHLPAGRLDPDADFFDAGGTSVDAVELIAELEGELGIEVDLDEVFADARPSSLARRWLPLLSTTPAGTSTGSSTAPAPGPDALADAPGSASGAAEASRAAVTRPAAAPVAESDAATAHLAAPGPTTGAAVTRPAAAPVAESDAATAHLAAPSSTTGAAEASRPPAAGSAAVPVAGPDAPVAGLAASAPPSGAVQASPSGAASASSPGAASAPPSGAVQASRAPAAGPAAAAPGAVPAGAGALHTTAQAPHTARSLDGPAPARTATRLPVPLPAARTPHRADGDRHSRARPEDLGQILADLALADRLPFTDVPEPVPPRRVLLTGATGFLGSHMLLDLLRHSDAHVYCLVRADDEAAATERLGEQLRGYRLPWSSEVRRRITVLPGDIRRPRLGLTDELWHTLAHELDSVVGVAAAVDFLRGYQSLRGSNVLGALTLAELAATGRPKPLHHISSIAVFNEVGITSMGEDDPLAHVDRLVSGYDQSKWAAEVALRRARDHGLIVTALRPGGIGGHTKTGAYNPQDLSSGLISAFGRYRTVPAFRHLNAAPVDWVSRVAVAAVCEPDAWGFDYNLTGVPNSLDDVVRDMALGGMHVRVQDWDEWRTLTLARLEAEPVPELGFLSRVLRSPTALKLCEATLKGPAAEAERTDALVAALGLAPAARYDAQAQLKTFEKLAGDGLARLPHKDDQPYLWFSETTEGTVGPVGAAASSPCSMALTLSIASMYQLVKERRVDVTGQVTCPALHPEPLTVERGDLWVRPEEGIPQQHGMRHQLLRYRLRLRDADGGRWWLEGRKYARARRDLWRQTRALTVEIGREGEAASLLGEVVVPADSYVRDQIDGIRVDPRLTGQEKRAAKLTWLAWFGLEMGRGLVAPFARAAADLLDLRRTPTHTEHNR
ncbi:thioester reductase domain-containing protein [Streptomyces sp. NPDC101171]|uniref:thioester reductase domain-containing protein n=1 Tax=Streptomyces sp. NPDC101171 TaxID=3366122 RepID=UPI0037F38B85